MNRIVIDSDISYWGYSARWLRSKLDNMSGDVEVELSSYGGDVFEGIAMFNMLRQYSKNKGKVTITVSSHAMSIASLIFLAGDVKKAHDNSTIMIHKAWTWLAGNADELEAEAKVLTGIDNILANQYSKYMKNSKEEIMDIMSSEGWYIGKEQMQATGFVDEFISSEDEVDVSARSNFKSAMARFSAKAKEENVKPNLDEVKVAILECNDGKCPVSNNSGSTIVPTASASENLISDDTTEINQGADMAFDRNDLDATEAHYNALVQNKVTMDSRNDTLKVDLQTAQTALEAKTEDMTKLVASHKTELSEAEGKLASFKTETETRLNEAVESKVPTAVALKMVQAATKEDSTKLALEAKNSDGGTPQGEIPEVSEDEKLQMRCAKLGITMMKR